MNRSPYKLRLIGQMDIKSEKDRDIFLQSNEKFYEHVSPFDILHSLTPDATGRYTRINTYLKVEKEDVEDGRNRSTRSAS